MADGDLGELLGGHQHRRQLRVDALGDLVGADDDHVEVPAHPLAGVGQRVHDVGDGRLVVDGEAVQVGPGGQEFFDAALHGDRLVGAGPGPGAGAGPAAVEEAGADPLGEAGAAFVHRFGCAEEGDVAAAAFDEVVGAFGAGGAEVEVDAGESLGVGGESDQDAGEAEAAEGLHAPVAHFDVHEDQAVHDGRGGDAGESGRAFVGGHEQDVLVVPAGLGDGAGGELHQHRQVHAAPQRQHHRDHAGLPGGQGAGSGVRVVAELGDRVHDAAGGVGRDRPLPAEHVGDGAGGDSGPRRDVGDGDPAAGVHEPARPKRSDARRAAPFSKVT